MTKFTSSTPIPGFKSKLNLYFVLHEVAFWALVLVVLVGTVLLGILGRKFDDTIATNIVLILLVVLYALRRPPLKYATRTTSKAPQRVERVLTKEEVAAIGGPLLEKLHAANRVAETAAQGPLGAPTSVTIDHDTTVHYAPTGTFAEPDLVEPTRSYATARSYPIPASIANALGSAATAQIQADTKAERL